MSAMADLTVYDGAATPVAHVMKPQYSRTAEGGWLEALYREELASVPEIAQVRLTLRQKKLGSGVWHCESKWEVPVMESVSGQNAAGYTASPKVAYVNTHKTVTFNHERASIAERRLVRQLGINSQGNIATSVAAATTGVLPELFDNLRFPT